MENQVFGALTIVLCSLLFFASYRAFSAQRVQWSILLIVLAGAILRVFASCDFFLHAWDERYHALVAKNLLENPWVPMLYQNPLLEFDYREWGSNHIWVHKQPVPLYAMALSMLIFGKHVLAVRLPSILLSTLTIFSTYKIGERLYYKKVGLIAAGLCAINGLMIEQTAGRVATDHIDVFFFSLISFAVYFLITFAEKNHYNYLIYGGILTGLAILTKWLPALIVIPIWLIASIYHRRSLRSILINGLLIGILITVIALPWQLYILHHFPLESAWEFAYNRKHILEALGTHDHPFYYHWLKMPVIFGEIIFIPLGWFMYSTLKNPTAYKNILLLTWIAIPYLFFSIAATKMQGYILFTAPAIFIMIAVFYDHLSTRDQKNSLLIKGITLLLFLLPVRYTIERVKPFDRMERTREWITKIKDLDQQHGTKPAVIFNCKYPIEAMFHTEMMAYEVMPSREKIMELSQEGYQIYLDDWQEIPTSLKGLEEVTYASVTGSLDP